MSAVPETVQDNIPEEVVENTIPYDKTEESSSDSEEEDEEISDSSSDSEEEEDEEEEEDLSDDEGYEDLLELDREALQSQIASIRIVPSFNKGN